MFGKIAFLTGVAIALLGAQAAKPPSSPLAQANLRGHWTCVQTGTSSGTFSEDWTPLFGGTWLRAIDTAKGQITGEHDLTFSKADSIWIVVDQSPLETYDVLHGTGSGAHSIVMHAVYPPKLALAVTYARLTPTQYTVDVNANVNRKKLRTHSVCNKH